MKKAFITNTVIYVLITILFTVYQIAMRYANMYLLGGLRFYIMLVSWIVLGASIFFMDFSNRLCNAIFLLINLIAVSVFYSPLHMLLFSNNNMMPMIAIIMAAMFAFGVAFPRVQTPEKRQVPRSTPPLNSSEEDVVQPQ